MFSTTVWCLSADNLVFIPTVDTHDYFLFPYALYFREIYKEYKRMTALNSVRDKKREYGNVSKAACVLSTANNEL
jgi:hypothetical protein